MNPTPISFDDATKQTSRSHNLTTLLENIGNPAWYVLPSGGTAACRKWRVCTDLKNAHVFVWLMCENVPIWIPCQSYIFYVAVKQTSRSRNFSSVLENTAKPAWYILPPDGRTAWRKCHVCSYKNACFRITSQISTNISIWIPRQS